MRCRNTMKIGIISEFKINTVNYGNNLQAYALNKYLRNAFPDYVIETIFFKDDKRENYARTSYFALLKIKIGRIWWRIKGKKSCATILDRELVKERLIRFHSFQNTNIRLSQNPFTWKDLLISDYDMFIVGSDVVWHQRRAFIDKIKFLDFDNTKKAVKVAYAASFGQNIIPFENINAIRRTLKSFRAISVRERSAVGLLNSIGVENVVHTVDPTLLLSIQEWSQIESVPRCFDIDKPYIFTYLLSADQNQQNIVNHIGKKTGLPVVYIPYASGEKRIEKDSFDNLRVDDCSPEEWLWLIHHARLVITDSFHGVVFSTIFKKNFLALKRTYINDINIRITDYLQQIHQEDKIINCANYADFDSLTWNYGLIESKLEKDIASSKIFLSKVMTR